MGSILWHAGAERAGRLGMYDDELWISEDLSINDVRQTSDTHRIRESPNDERRARIVWHGGIV